MAWCVVARNRWENEGRKTDNLTIAATPETLDQVTEIFMKAVKAAGLDVDYVSCGHKRHCPKP